MFTAVRGALSNRNYYSTHSLPVLTTSPFYWNSILSGKALDPVMHGYVGITLWIPANGILHYSG